MTPHSFNSEVCVNLRPPLSNDRLSRVQWERHLIYSVNRLEKMRAKLAIITIVVIKAIHVSTDCLKCRLVNQEMGNSGTGGLAHQHWKKLLSKVVLSLHTADGCVTALRNGRP